MYANIHEKRGHDLAVDYIGGMLREQAAIINKTSSAHPSWSDYRAQLTALVWAHDGLIAQSGEEFGTNPEDYEIQL